LTTLDLSANCLGDAEARALAESPYLAGLKTLALGANSIGDDGCRALAGSPHLAGLTSLNLFDNAIEAAGAAALSQSPYLRNANIETGWNPYLGVGTYIREIAEVCG
jgi:hypothetical protein